MMAKENCESLQSTGQREGLWKEGYFGGTAMARQELVYEICSRRGPLLYTCSWWYPIR